MTNKNHLEDIEKKLEELKWIRLRLAGIIRYAKKYRGPINDEVLFRLRMIGRREKSKNR